MASDLKDAAELYESFREETPRRAVAIPQAVAVMGHCDGTRLAAGRAQSAVRFGTRGTAAAFARNLKRQYRRPLKGVRLKVSGV